MVKHNLQMSKQNHKGWRLWENKQLSMPVETMLELNMPVETMLELNIPQHEMERTPACQEAAEKN